MYQYLSYSEKIVRNKIGPHTCSFPSPLAGEVWPQMDRFSKLTSIYSALAVCIDLLLLCPQSAREQLF